MLSLVILGGGKGTRLKSFVKKSKILASVFNKSILEHTIDNCKNIKKKYLLINKSQKDIIKIVKKKNLPVNLLFEDKPLGDGGCLTSLKKIRNYEKMDFLIVHGDLLGKFDYFRFYKLFKKKKSKISVICHPNKHPKDSDLVYATREGEVIELYLKPHENKKLKSNLALSGVILIKGQIVKQIPEKKISFQKILNKNIKKTFIYRTREFIKDLGTPKRLMFVRQKLSLQKVSKLNFRNKIPAVFLDRDGVINRELEGDKFNNPNNIFPNTVKALKQIDPLKYLLIIITNQSCISKGFLTEQKLAEMHFELLSFLSSKGVLIQDIYYCPHYPESGYKGEVKALKIKCDCRKPNVGMFKNAINDYNIDIKNSFFVGNSYTDYLAAKKLKLKYYHIYKDNKVDFLKKKKQFKNLLEFTKNTII